MSLARTIRRVGTAWRTLSENGLWEFLQEIAARVGWLGNGSTEMSKHPASAAGAQLFQISVVIPVFNGGQGLRDLLDSVHRQKGCELQIVLVDSGTTDGSLSSIDAYPEATVVSLGEPFSHSVFRNRGVELARFPLVFLTVQDALIPDDSWLSSLCMIHKEEGLAALSVGETPRAEADAFARFTLGAYHHSLGLLDGATMIHRGLPEGRRLKIRSASIGNVGCLYLRETLKMTPFVGTFGEDFRMGYALLKQGLAVGITSELRVVHSHNRSPSYWLKRAYRSRELLVELGLNNWRPKGKATDREEPLRAMVRVFGWLSEQWDPMSALGKVSLSLTNVRWTDSGVAGLQVIDALDPDLGEWLRSFGSFRTGPDTLPYYLRDTLIDLYRFLLVDTSGLADRRADVLVLILKGLASTVGTFLASVSYPCRDDKHFWALPIERMATRV